MVWGWPVAWGENEKKSKKEERREKEEERVPFKRLGLKMAETSGSKRCTPRVFMFGTSAFLLIDCLQ